MTIGTGQHPPGVVRIHAQRPDVALIRYRFPGGVQATNMGPGFTAVGTHVQVLAECADENCVIVCHTMSPYWIWNSLSPKTPWQGERVSEAGLSPTSRLWIRGLAGRGGIPVPSGTAGCRGSHHSGNLPSKECQRFAA